MRGINVQKIMIEKEENEKLYKALYILKEFSDAFNTTKEEVGLTNVEELDELSDNIFYIKGNLEDFLDNLGFCNYIEIEG